MATPDFNPAMIAPEEVVSEFLIPPVTGGVLSLVLCGMCIPRLFDYYSHFPQDRRRNKIAVAIVGLGTIFYAMLQLVYLIRTGSLRLHTIASLAVSQINTLLFPIAYTVIFLPAQLILAERAWKLNRNSIWLAVWLGLTITASSVASISSVSCVFLAQNNISAHCSALRITIPAATITLLIVDLTIVVGTVAGLHRYSKTFLASSQEGLGFGGAKLIRAAWQTSVESAVFPTLLNIIALVLHYVRPASLLFSVSSFLIPPVYCLTLLFSLGRRQTHLSASHFRTCFPNVSTNRDRHPPTVNNGSTRTVRYSNHVSQHVEGSIAVTFSGEGGSVERDDH